MLNTLIDAGPIIALFDRSDRCHETALDALKSQPRRLVSTWPVITEASHMLDFDRRAPTARRFTMCFRDRLEEGRHETGNLPRI